MNRRRKRPEIDFESLPEPTPEPPFDLRQGIMALVIFMGIMVLLSLVCAFFW